VSGARGAAQRFLTTVLMTDIVGSTEHASELGDKAWRDLLQQHHALVRRALKAHDGREIDTAGDGFFAIFDAPAEAIACALGIASSVRDLGIEIRAGLHTGEVEQIDAKVGGITVPIASRIMVEAAPGEVLASSTVRDLAAGAGLTFQDKGSRTLKGVAGKWRIYAAVRPETATGAQAAASATDLGARRAAAVRRARAQPIWRRRPRATAVAVVALAIVLAIGSLLVWQPWLRPALGAIKDNSVGLIDTGRDVITASIEVGQRPGGAVVSDGALWVTNTGSATVSQISPDSQTVTRIIDVGPDPIGIAATDGSVWVANSGRRSVSQISTSTGRVVNEISVGNGPTAVAAGAGYLWVANSGDSTVSRIDPNTASVDMRIPVAARPIAIAADDLGVWIASADGATVTHLDPETGVTLAAPIPLGGLPVGVGLGSGSVWVATTDGRVTRINPDQNRIATVVDTGGSLSSIVADDSAVWVADREGWVVRLDAADPSAAPTRIGISSSPEALALSEGSVWVATRASPSSHRGGTLRVLFAHLQTLDPLGYPYDPAAYLEANGLVGYRHVGGIAGSTLLPDLATSLPQPSNGGLTYSFQLRPDLLYSTGEPVLASDFRRAIERSFQVNPDPDPAFQLQYQAILGAEACLTDDGARVERCDLSQGILTDEASRTVTFNLSEADPDFLYKLALPAAYPVAASVRMDGLVEGAFPGTGPYTISSTTQTEVRMIRNPNFRVWDEDVRPDGYPDEIVWTSGIEPDEQIAVVERGDADWMPFRGDNRISPEALATVRGRYAAQLQSGANGTTAAWMNTTLAPFDSLEVRQAVNLAVDRARVADLYGGPVAAAVTCQYLPPGWLGYEPYCPYTTHPDPGGRWQAPDLDTARQLVDASGTKGADVVVGPVRARHAALRDYVVSVLQELGYDAVADPRTDDDSVFGGIDEGTTQIGVFEFFSATQAPSEFLSGYTCYRGDGLSNYCDESYDDLFRHALDLQTTDMAAAASSWAEVDRATVDRAIFVPLVNEGSDFLSQRVGNYQFSPGLGVLLDQLWVQ
jgi:YVTN family beta-propeller protein